jgi:hypothetical protein
MRPYIYTQIYRTRAHTIRTHLLIYTDMHTYAHMRQVALSGFRLHFPASGIVRLSEEQTRSVDLLFISTAQDTERRNICCFDIGDFLICLSKLIWIEVRWWRRATAQQSACCRLADLTSLAHKAFIAVRALPTGTFCLLHSSHEEGCCNSNVVQNILRRKKRPFTLRAFNAYEVSHFSLLYFKHSILYHISEYNLG